MSELAIDGTTLRIEHVSYFTESNGLDLTVSKLEYLEGTRRYSYDDSLFHQCREI